MSLHTFGDVKSSWYFGVGNQVSDDFNTNPNRMWHERPIIHLPLLRQYHITTQLGGRNMWAKAHKAAAFRPRWSACTWTRTSAKTKAMITTLIINLMCSTQKLGLPMGYLKSGINHHDKVRCHLIEYVKNYLLMNLTRKVNLIELFVHLNL